jgi:hypothetical protein
MLYFVDESDAEEKLLVLFSEKVTLTRFWGSSALVVLFPCNPHS